jgi:hypothetical protein
VFHRFLQTFFAFIEQQSKALFFVSKIRSINDTLHLLDETIEKEFTRMFTEEDQKVTTLEEEKQNILEEIEDLTDLVAKQIGLSRKKIKIIFNGCQIVWKISRNEAHRITCTNNTRSSSSSSMRFFLLKTLVSGILFTSSRLEKISYNFQALEKKKEKKELQTLNTLKEIGLEEKNQQAIEVTRSH